MSRLKLRHLGVEDEDGAVCGIVTSRDLLRLRAQEATMLGDALVQADDVAALGLAWAQLPQAAAALVAEGVSGRDVAAVISRELAGLTRRAGVLAEARMRAEGQGEPPCDYALCVLGSGGRGESLLAMDQDNAIVFAAGEPDGAEDRWFARLGAHRRRYPERGRRALLHGRRHGAATRNGAARSRPGARASRTG